jgi:hypothetical protein
LIVVRIRKELRQGGDRKSEKSKSMASNLISQEQSDSEVNPPTIATRLFISERRKPLSRVTVWLMITETARAADLDHLEMHPHMLRHTCSYALVKKRDRHPGHSTLPRAPVNLEYRALYETRQQPELPNCSSEQLCRSVECPAIARETSPIAFDPVQRVHWTTPIARATRSKNSRPEAGRHGADRG